MQVKLDLNSTADYRLFLKVKELPKFRFSGRVAEFPDEYAGRLGVVASGPQAVADYSPIPSLFDYQRDIAKIAIQKRKFAAFLECGLGKTLVLTEFARHCADVLPPDKCVLIVSPLMVIKQTLSEIERFYGASLPVEQVRASGLGKWLESGSRIGITNYEAIVDDLPTHRIGTMILDESSLLKSYYGKWGQRLIEMGRGVPYKLCLTGTPAPNDRIEYANHAVFLDAFPTVNSFLARFFVNKGQTDNRWEIKPHALRPFYRALSHWCIFLTNPSVYGWKDNVATIPPIQVHIEELPMSAEQSDAARSESKSLFAVAGGITSRAKLAQIAKGRHNGKDIETIKPTYIRDRIASWSKTESTLVWCRYNAEQDSLAETMPDAANISGDTPDDDRQDLICLFQNRKRRTMISKAKILGFGLNLQVCTRMIFSTLQDSYEEYWQAVKRANRIGSTLPLQVHVPVMEIERPMVENVLRKARMVERDTKEQEQLFKEFGYVAA